MVSSRAGFVEPFALELSLIPWLSDTQFAQWLSIWSSSCNRCKNTAVHSLQLERVARPQESNGRQLSPLLRARRERPRSRRSSAEQRDEFAAFQLIE
jgi:hypothetical protein